MKNMQTALLDVFKENEPPNNQVINHMPQGYMTPYSFQPYYLQPPYKQLSHFANSLTGTQNNNQLLKAIEQLTNKVATLESSQIGKKNGGNNGKQRKRNTLTHYCHTHGLCAHGMSITGMGECIPCKSPGPNHKAEATLVNKMGGSTAFCP